MQKTLLVLFFPFLVLACNSKKSVLPSDADISLPVLLEVAPSLRYPVVVNDSVLRRTGNDSLLLHTAAFRAMIPDTVFSRHYGDIKQPKLYVLGKTTTADKGTYLFVKATDGKKQRVHFYFFTNRQQYLGSMLLSDRVEKTASLNRYCRMDSRQNIAFITEKKMPTGEFWTGETIYYMNSEGQMVLAVTNTNEDLSDEIRGNPVDTLPRTHRHSGDYSTDRKNLVSVRDGIRPNTFRFFIHFSKQQGDCIGEVKGEGEWTGPHTGIFRDNNSPCVLEFRFTSASVSIRETDGCGSYRGITCFFEGTYPLKKTPLQKKKK